MAYYRLYHRQRGHIFSVDDFQAAQDSDAIALAKAHLREHAAELWCGARLVKAFALSDALGQHDLD